MVSHLGVSHVLKRAAEIFPWQEVVAHDGRSNYKKIYENVLRLANFFNKEGIGYGDVIAVLDFNTIRYMTLIYAASLVNAIVFPVNFKLPYLSIKRNLEIAKVKAIFCGEMFSELMKLLGLEYYNLSNYNEWIKNNEPINSEPDILSHFALLFNSSDKELTAVLYSQYQFPLAAMSLITHLCTANPELKLGLEDTILSPINMNYVFSWGSIFIAPLVGAKLVLADWFDPERTLRIISSERVSYLFASPSMIESILERQSNFSNLKVLVGGDIISPNLAHKMRDAGLDYYYLHGSEIYLALGTSMVLNNYRKVVDATRVYPLPFVELKVFKDNFQEAGIEEVGEVMCRTIWAPKILYSKDKRSYYNGWYKTGAIGMRKEDGSITILSNNRKIIRSGDEIIPARYIENLIKDVVGNAEVLVIGVPDEKWGERPVAFIKGRNVEISRIWDYLYHNLEMGRILKWWLPLKIVVVDRIPKLDLEEEEKEELIDLIKIKEKDEKMSI